MTNYTADLQPFIAMQMFARFWCNKTLTNLLSSHRPVEVHNIYNQVQVRLLIREDHLENIPEFGDVFNEDEVRFLLLTI
jgi:hypothetical protein